MFKGVGIGAVSFPQYPNSIFLLKPMFYAPDDDVSTLLTGSLKASGLFEEIFERRGKSIIFWTKNGKIHEFPVITKAKIDYIHLRCHSPGQPFQQVHQPIHLSLASSQMQQQLQHHSVKAFPKSSPLFTLLLHFKFGHRSIDSLQEMINSSHINLPKGYPKKLSPMPIQCPVCIVMGAVRFARGPCVDTTELPVGTLLHFDFQFYNKISRHGFTSALTGICATSCRKWIFPCRSK